MHQPESTPTDKTIEQLIDPTWVAATRTANGIAQHYYRTASPGSGKPAVVLLHGFEDQGLSWLRVAQVLAQTYDVVMLDARGHGRSAGPENGFSAALLAADVVALIQTLELHQPALLGHSMGAATAVSVAANHPQLIRAILLEDPPMRAMPVPDRQTNPQYAVWYQSWLDQMQALKTQSPAERRATALRFLPGA
ncbi:MAG: alpha/beta hydrolase, partial [Chloroflexaceae bacterium]|nr:alpha/beta hydrolase [Chloroflexaceae bacterium]